MKQRVSEPSGHRAMMAEGDIYVYPARPCCAESVQGWYCGWEIDRADRTLGTLPHALVVATATQFSSVYHWVKEELTHTHSANTGETCPFVRCDMVFYETPNGGAVFATSSIAWAGALAHNGYRNNVSRLTANVIRRFLDPTPF